MANVFTVYRPFLSFLLRFIVSYAALAFLYQGYLLQYDSSQKEVDYITYQVAEQSKWVLQFFDETAYTAPNPKEAGIKLFYHNTWIARIIEGCNAVSVMILFAAFVVAFRGTWQRTLWFIPLGIGIIHLANILRIALLAIALYHFPTYEHALHGVLFPMVIYGIVFLLWMAWVNYFSKYAGPSKK
ncbi:exosortase family protein XrtF [Flavobacterium sp.]|uniref:exosortase family protein XrtF n=1 Tax=Flavobacterium sp. TaxID=239 RepID=UPI0022CA9C8F|nr:exosortase family protein XrtF [Flavobacterium sp.]MCZ8143949.1 exosortase family protein XrtF [Flavobacterium sp.]MCZ8367327.1 exosortase family protein XrtF [Flavobacterium sp.]